jgi:hypothetical protein
MVESIRGTVDRLRRDEPAGADSKILRAVAVFKWWAFAVLVGWALIATFPNHFHSLSPGLDSSWGWAINFVSSHPGLLHFGRDANFTYGPLGYLLEPYDLGRNLPIAVGFWTLIQVSFAAVLFGLFRRRRKVVLLAIFCVAFVSSRFLGFLYDYQVQIVILLLLLLSLEAEGLEAKSALGGASFFAALAPFMKFTFGLAATVMTLFTFLIWARRRRPGWKEGVAAAALIYFVSFAGVAAIYIGSVGSFLRWLHVSIEISSGYSVAMSTIGPWQIVLAGLSGIGIIGLVTAGGLIFKSFDRVVAVTIASPAVFVAFKHGFSRHEGRFFLPFLIAVFGVLVLTSKSRRDAMVALGALLVVGFVLAPANCRYEHYGGGPCLEFTKRNLRGAQGWEGIGSAIHLHATRNRLAAESAANLAAQRLPPELTDPLKGASVDVFPYELTYIPANHLTDWRPNPILQAYQAYTPYLDEVSARHLLGDNSPKYLFLHFDAVDGRQPMIDAEATWQSIISNYRLVRADPNRNMLLLRSQGKQRPIRLVRMASQEVKQKEWVELPASRGQVFARVEMPMTLMGTIRKLLFKIDPVYIDLRRPGGRVETYRVIVETMRDGMMIGLVPGSVGEAAEFLSTGSAPRVEAFRLHGPGARWYSKKLQITWEQAASQPVLGG